MVKKKSSGFMFFLIVTNLIGLIYKIDLTSTYLIIAFIVFTFSFGSFIYLNIKLSRLTDNKQNVNNKAISTLSSLVTNSPSTMVSSVLPYVVVAALNLSLKAFGITV